MWVTALDIRGVTGDITAMDRRLIQRIDAVKFDHHIGQWLLEQKLINEPDGVTGCGLAEDGKTVRGSHKGSRISNEPELYYCTDFPHSRQFFLIEREVDRHIRGEVLHSVDIAYGVTSLKQERTSAERLLELNRNHWDIENRVHCPRDFTFDEDRCRIRTGNGPRVMATIRNLAISLSRSMGFRFITEAIRAFTFCSNRKDVLTAWGLC